MANAIVNRLNVKGEKTAVMEFNDFIKNKGIIDFNEIIPMPEKIIALERQNGCAEDGYFRWTKQHWGSKGNAYNFSNKRNTENDIWFQTSGGNALIVIKKLSEMFPDLEFTYVWYDNFDIGSNVGKCVCKNTVLLEQIKLSDGSKMAFEFIFSINGRTPKEEGLVYNQEIDNYECVQ